MVEKRKKKSCSKAKREKEIIQDLEVLSRRVNVLEAMQESNQEWDRAERIARELDQVQAAQRRLHQELNGLWTQPGIKKRRARQRDGHS